MKKIHLIGCGNLGRRYLQAIDKINDDIQIIVYDVSIEAIHSTKRFVSENNLNRANFVFTEYFEEFLSTIDSESVVINAATAKGRVNSLLQILMQEPKILFIEKPVTQTQSQFNELMLESKNSATKIFVHYTLRFQPFCKKLKAMIDVKAGFQYISNLPKMGLACVGIHQLDLFKWLYDIESYKMVNSNYFGTYEQKRSGFYDVYGDILLNIEPNGYALFTNYNIDNVRSLQINSEDGVINVLEDEGVFTIVKKRGNSIVHKEECKVLFASSYLTEIIESFLKNSYEQRTDLVSLSEALFSHKIIFDYFERHSIDDLNIT